MVTPMLVVILANRHHGTVVSRWTPSRPVFGLTREPYLVFAVNAFALLGLRQLYFLLGSVAPLGLSAVRALSVLLLFIVVKLILERSGGLAVPSARAAVLPVPVARENRALS